MFKKEPINVWRACNKIRAAIFRVGVDLLKHFKELDVNCDGLISEAQFVSVLGGPLKLVVGLSDQEISEISDYFRVQDGRVTYINFCDAINGEVPNFSQNESLSSGLEWNDPYHVNQLGQYEEKRVQILLSKIATHLKKKCILLRPYFQDYELIAKGNGTVTITHFARVLHFHGILLSSDDFNILLKKFLKDSYAVNYIAFIAAVSDIDEYVDKYNFADNQTGALCGNVITADIPKLVRPEIGLVRNRGVFGPRISHHPSTNPINKWKCHGKVHETMARIQRHALANRIRTGDFFKDFDGVNCGKITLEQFRRGLDGFGISGVHHLYLSEQEINDIINIYRDPNDQTRVCWQVFENDVDLIFTTKNLEKYPNLKLANPEQEKIQSFNSVCNNNWTNADAVYRNLVEEIVGNIRKKIQTHSMNIRPHFKDYDRRNCGHVTIPQFRQCLVYYGFLLSVEEIFALEERYSDEMGFNYIWFLSEVEPIPIEAPLVVAEGIRVNDFFVDYDKLKKQIISEENFKRGLKMCGFNLSNTEVKTIIDVFKYPFQDGYIDYDRFGKTVESACTIGGLERDPMLVPVKHVPPKDFDTNFLNGQEREAVNSALTMLAQRCIYDPNLLECFKDFDPHCCGSVSRNNFMRVMALRKMTDHLSSKELDLLMKCFGVKKGDEVSYRAFCKCLDTLVAIGKKKPF
ncbi:uncharacterized protein [Hetaerina americana]|uniref:uncharacterized protein n=1 Tax=Hetaerina americana TaxID=62018 RepID=UPI003A7F525E